ncbi:hypothetical protein LXL04_037058 [Taraxacum kok-saghyz]
MKAKSFLPFIALDVAVDVCPSLIETMYCLLHLQKSIANSHRPVHPVIETLRKIIDFAFACDIAAPQILFAFSVYKAEIFIKIFVSGLREQESIQGEFIPAGADGKIMLSFNLLNANPRDWIYDWYMKI